jgi:hypothetical protein
MGVATQRAMIDNTHVVVPRGTGTEMIPVPEMEAFAEAFRVPLRGPRAGRARTGSARVERPFAFVENSLWRAERSRVGRISTARRGSGAIV